MKSFKVREYLFSPPLSISFFYLPVDYEVFQSSRSDPRAVQHVCPHRIGAGRLRTSLGARRLAQEGMAVAHREAFRCCRPRGLAQTLDRGNKR